MLTTLQAECKKLNYTPRPVQIQAIEWLENNWNNIKKCSVLSMPVGSGKSLISKTLASFNQNKEALTAIITPQNMLVDQYIHEFKDLNSLKGKSHYKCNKAGDCELGQELARMTDTSCDKCPYLRSKNLSYIMPTIFNPLSYMNLPKVGNGNNYIYDVDTIIIDEVQSLSSMLREFTTLRLWEHDIKWESGISSSIPGLLKILQEYNLQLLLFLESDNLELKEKVKLVAMQRKISFLSSQIEKNSHLFICEETIEKFRNIDTKCLLLRPKYVLPTVAANFFKIAKKIIFMSGTILPFMYQELGFQDVDYLDLPSPIPKERRQIFVTSKFKINAKMEATERLESIKMMTMQIKYIVEILHPNENGVILLPYGLAVELRPFLIDEYYLWMDKKSKIDKISEFKTQKHRLVGVFSGSYEGLSLDHNQSRFTIIPKIPYANLMDKVVKARFQENKKNYELETIGTVIQASGRSSRSEKDFSAIYILDGNFKALYAQTSEFLPKYFKESLIYAFPSEKHIEKFNTFRREYETACVT